MSEEPEATPRAEGFTASPNSTIIVDGVLIGTSVLPSGVILIEVDEL